MGCKRRHLPLAIIMEGDKLVTLAVLLFLLAAAVGTSRVPCRRLLILAAGTVTFSAGLYFAVNPYEPPLRFGGAAAMCTGAWLLRRK